ncbi:MAG: radical SAM protein [Sphaerospermopsis kisseleviana]
MIPANSEMALAAALGSIALKRSRPRHPLVHLVTDGPVPRALIVNRSRLVDLPQSIARSLDYALASEDDAAVRSLLALVGLDEPADIDDSPLESPPLHAISLAVAQGCNLACGYCYAQQGSFGGPSTRMSMETARLAVKRLIEGRDRGERVNIAFLGGEPLLGRAVMRDATRYAAALGSERGVQVGFSITTNGTLLTEEDGFFFENHGFAVTISVDGVGPVHDALRPALDGSGTYDRLMERVRPLLRLQDRMQVSARVTVTPRNINLLETLQAFAAAGFHSVGFSPLLRASNGQDELKEAEVSALLEALISCGLAYEKAVLTGQRLPFANLESALRELDRGTHRPYPCGAGAGYLAVSANGDFSACHRFVEADDGQMGSLTTGIDSAARNQWLAERHVHAQHPCQGCWARYLCGGGCHHEVLGRGRPMCEFIRGWLHYVLQAHSRLERVLGARGG